MYYSIFVESHRVHCLLYIHYTIRRVQIVTRHRKFTVQIALRKCIRLTSGIKLRCNLSSPGGGRNPHNIAAGRKYLSIVYCWHVYCWKHDFLKPCLLIKVTAKVNFACYLIRLPMLDAIRLRTLHCNDIRRTALRFAPSIHQLLLYRRLQYSASHGLLHDRIYLLLGLKSGIEKRIDASTYQLLAT